MAFDLQEHHRTVESAVASQGPLTEGMASLIHYCRRSYPHKVWDSLQKLPFDQGFIEMRKWLEKLLAEQPPSHSISAFWFGIFNPVLRDKKPGCDLYLSGSDRYSPDDKEWAVWNANTYLPNGRYAHSHVINSIYRSARSLRNQDAALMGEYALCLGYACLSVADLIKDMDRDLLLGGRDERYITVGFDEGSFVNIARLSRNGV